MPVKPEISQETWDRYVFLRDNGHLDYVIKANKCEDFFAGLQWDPRDLTLLRAQKRPALTINKILSTLSNVMGEQIYNRTDIAFKPRNQGATEDVANALTKVFMQIGDNNLLSWVRSDVFADGVITSRGFFDTRLDFTDTLQGEVRVTQLNPKNVLIDADGDSYDPDNWNDVFVTKWMTADEIELLYSKKDADILRSRQGSSFPFGYDSIDQSRDRFGSTRAHAYGAEASAFQDSMVRNIRVLERQYKKLDKVEHFVNLTTGDTRIIPGDWDTQRVGQYLLDNPDVSIVKKLIKRIRWTVVADDVVLHDDWSPYKHFTVVPFFPHFRRGRTLGLVENLLGPQELLNKTSSQELHVVNTTANSGWKVKKNALQNMSTGELEQRGAQSGLVIELDEIDNAEKIVPNQTPSGLDRISYKAEEHIKSISGVSDYQTGQAREDVSAKAISQNKQSGSANLAKVMDNMNRTDHILARNILDMIQEYYTEERLIMITTDKLSNKVEPMTVNQITPEGEIVNNLSLGEFAVVVTNQPERDTFEDTQFDQAVRLRLEAGVAIPDKYIILSSRLKDKAQMVQEMEGDQESPEAKAAAALQQRAALADVMTKEAEAQMKGAEAQLKVAKTQHEMVKAQKEADTPPEDNGIEAEMHKIEVEAQLEREKMEMEHELAIEKMNREFELKQEQVRAKMALDRDMAKEQAKTDRVAAFHGAGSATKPKEQ